MMWFEEVTRRVPVQWSEMMKALYTLIRTLGPAGVSVLVTLLSLDL